MLLPPTTNDNHRVLAKGDFDRLNQLLDGVVIQLPDARVSTSVITLNMINPRCTSLRIDDFGFEAKSVSAAKNLFQKETVVKIDIKGLDMVCYLDYVYTFLFTNRGKAELYTFDNHASISMAFQPPTFLDADTTFTTLFRPSQSKVNTCDPQVNVQDMNFRGSISAWVLDTIERLMRRRLEAEAEKRICQELQSLSETFLADLLMQADNVLAQYPPNMLLDPLESEKELIASAVANTKKSVNLVDLLDDKSTATAKWADRILADAVEWVTKPVVVDDDDDDSNTTDGASPGGTTTSETTTTTTTTTMNINVLVRENLLTPDDRALELDNSNNQTMLLFERHDRFVDTAIVLDRVKVFGLDQLDVFEPLQKFGKYTMKNRLSWSLLTVEMDLTINIKPSTRGDSVFAAASGKNSVSDGVKEKVKIKFGLENVHAVVSTLLAIDEDKLGALRLGSLLSSDTILDCTLSTIHGVELSGLLMEIGDIRPPTVQGFLSRGIDQVVSNSVDAVFQMYEATILKAAPGFFHTFVRRFLNKNFLASYQPGNVADRDCSPLKITSSAESGDAGYVDFRDFLLPPDEAMAAGGKGTEPYGDIVHTFVSQFREQFLESDLDGSPRINEVIRTTLAESYNVTDAGVLLGAVFNWNNSLELAGLRAIAGVKIFDARIENLDSFGSPLELLSPLAGEAHMLNNTASIGVTPNPVRLAARVLLTVSDDADLQLRNEVAVSLDVGEARVAAVLLLQILEKPFFSVPLEDTLNLNCWLTTILPNASEVQRSLLVQHALSVEKLHLNISCISCSNPDFDDLIYQLYSNATSKAANLVDLLRGSDYFRFTTDEFLSSASRQCPHHMDYDPSFSFTEYFVKTGGGLGFSRSIRDKKAVYFNVANAVLLVCLVLSFAGFKFTVTRRHHAWRETLTGEALGRLACREAREREQETELNEKTESMYQSQHLPRRIRILVPATLVATIGIQLGGHLAVLSTINIEGMVAGGSFAVSDFLEFSFIKATLRSYNNGGSEMAILLFMFTGVWPYIKLLTSLALWFAPPRVVSVARRESIFVWLDVFAKLSVVDIFTTLIVVAAFLVFIGGTDEKMAATGEFFATRLIVVPGAGFYCLIIAQRITRISSRYLLDCHHQLLASATREWVLAVRPRRTESVESEDTNDDADIRGTDSRVSGQAEDNEIATNAIPQTQNALLPETGRGRGHVGNKSCQLLLHSLWRRVALATKEWQSTHLAALSTEWSWDTNDDASISPASRNSSHAEKAESGVWIGNKSRSHEIPPNKFWGHIAVGLTGVTVLIIGIVGCVLAPSLSLDTETVWGLFESGQTFAAAVTGYPVFKVICAILVRSRFVLDSARAKTGLGFLLVLVVVTSFAFPAMNAIVFVRRWNHNRKRHVGICLTLWTRLKKSPALILHWCKSFQQGTESYASFGGDLDLVPAYRRRAWEHLEVYLLAFAIACWQLGAVVSYTIHQYCTILESLFDTAVFLGLVEKTSAQCFREQASSPSSLLIICMSFLVLLASFLFQAIGQYRKVMATAAKQIKDADVC